MRIRHVRHAVLPAAAAAALLALGVAPAAQAVQSAGAPAQHSAAAVRTAQAVPAFAGHTYVLTLDNGAVLRNSYSADGKTLNWTALAGPMQGRSGQENLTVRAVGEGLYFVNWVEASGMTVSHVMDLRNKTVSVYWTYGTPDGGRTGELHTATLERVSS
ncbi:MoaF N-terminal domain-containing protein [Streptomyces sp. UNOC14_S4]|uniref:MoaF-related domain-containing protein n=1 Tax=Streptomyces sp. UNOC14_S4 TaxID=2872340 RepID=UPI001E365475|nr:MoaF N-terminal domain-containing protein [Streptomyces sp. UNOC14_S4]MCC3767054.1 MoaF N-terminal domain-containing protein [Streptomyces sp. UNOC14_S4]